MNIYGSVALGIMAEKLDFKDITKKVGIKPTTIFKKGEKYGIISRPSEVDSWVYEVEFNENEEPNLAIQKLLTHLYMSKENIRILSEQFDIAIICNITSGSDQIYTLFSSDTIKKISELNVSLEMSILSIGDIEEK